MRRALLCVLLLSGCGHRPVLPVEKHDRFARAGSLHNAALDPGISSLQRIRLMRACLSELDAAEGEAANPRAGARVMVAKAFFLWTWGFPRDAEEELRRAEAIDPKYPELDDTARLMAHMLAFPTDTLPHAARVRF